MRKKEAVEHIPIKDLDPEGEILRLAEWVKRRAACEWAGEGLGEG